MYFLYHVFVIRDSASIFIEDKLVCCVFCFEWKSSRYCRWEQFHPMRIKNEKNLEVTWIKTIRIIVVSVTKPSRKCSPNPVKFETLGDFQILLNVRKNKTSSRKMLAFISGFTSWKTTYKNTKKQVLNWIKLILEKIKKKISFVVLKGH